MSAKAWTIEEIERRLAVEFPGKTMKLSIDIYATPLSGFSSSITLQQISDGIFEVTNCRSIVHAIECLRETMKPVNVGRVEIQA